MICPLIGSHRSISWSDSRLGLFGPNSCCFAASLATTVGCCRVLWNGADSIDPFEQFRRAATGFLESLDQHVDSLDIMIIEPAAECIR